MLSLTTRLAAVHEATSAGERAAVRALVDELTGPRRGPAGTRARVELDDADSGAPAPGLRWFYTGRWSEHAADLDAAARLRRWAPGLVPDPVRERYSLERIAELDELAVAELDPIVARPEAPSDGRLAVLGLVRAAFEACLAEPRGSSGAAGGADLIVLRVHPALVRPFAKLLGARRYGGELCERSGGAEVPMLVIPSDVGHFERVGSLLTPLAWKTFVLGRRPQVSLASLRAAFVDDLDPDLDVERDWPLVEQRLVRRGTQRGSLFQGLRPGIVDELHARGRVVAVAEGADLYAEGDPAAELYVVLSGCFELRVDGEAVDVAGHGEVLGEVEVLRPDARRSATARALIPSRALALSTAALRKLTLGDPEAGFLVMANLARFLAERFSEASRLAERLDRALERAREP